MGFLSSLFKKKQTTTVHAFAGQEADFEAAKQARAEFLEQAPSGDSVSQAFNAASALMLDRKYEACIAAYGELATRFPDRRGDCESQIGAAWYFLKDLNKAIEFYVQARAHGADASMMDDNIWEACEAQLAAGDAAAAQRYLELCPDGSYVKKARKALGR